MGWRNHLSLPQSVSDKTLKVFPWFEGRYVVDPTTGERWEINNRPRRYGWYRWRLYENRIAIPHEPYTEPIPAPLGFVFSYPNEGGVVWVMRNSGYGSGSGYAYIRPLGLPEDLDPFTRTQFSMWLTDRGEKVGIYSHQLTDSADPSELAVMEAFLREEEDIAHIKGVSPMLHHAWRTACQVRNQKREIEKRIREEEERQKRLSEVGTHLGTSVTRRLLASSDFRAAATAALSLSSCEFLYHQVTQVGVVVTFRHSSDRVFECVCDPTLRIIDSGICLTADDRRWDEELTLESLPGVITEAIRTRQLVVLRRVYGEDP